jgi:TolB-like protein/DNA-binding SARP family transcriptional activator
MEAQIAHPLTLRLLGGLEVRAADGSDLTPPGRKTRALLACLALPPGSSWSREQLTAVFWGNRDEEQARGSLREALVKLRRCLGEPSPLQASRETVALDPAVICVDAIEFTRLAKAGELERASEHFRGELLEGLSLPDGGFEDWLLVERTRLHDLAIDVLSRLLASQDGDPAVRTAQRLLQLDPTREEACRALMQLYAKTGNRSQALRQYQTCRDNLQRELNVAPSPETEALHRQIKDEPGPRHLGGMKASRSSSLASQELEMPAVALETATPPVRQELRPRRSIILAGFAVLLAVATGATALWWRYPPPQSPTLPLPDRPSIAVLPFDNLSGDERLGRLADGMVEDVTTNLSHFRELFVISHTSTFVYKGKPTDVRQIGRDLGVQYLLEGAVQSGKYRLDVTVQLIDATTGAQVWSERYDRPLDDLFNVQIDVTDQVAGSIGGMPGALRRAALEAARRRSPQSLEAYDLFLLGNEARIRVKQEDHGRAMDLLQRAVALDPSFEPAHVALALGHWNEVDYGWAPFHSAMDAWLNEAQAAVALDPGDAMGHVALGMRYGYANEFDRSAAEFDTALRANFNDPDALGLIGGNLSWLEPPGRAVELVERAQRLNPYASKISHMSKLAYFYAGDFEKSIAKCMAHGDLSFFDYLYLAMNYGELGKSEEANANAAEVLHLNPQFSAEWMFTYNGEFAPAAAVNQALFLHGLAKAGLPHCATAEQIAADPGIKHLAECDTERSRSN